MKGFDLYETFRSCVFEVSGFTERSWDALEIWERRAWEEFSKRVYHRNELFPIPVRNRKPKSQ